MRPVSMLLALAGCGTCPPLSEVEIRDPDGLAGSWHRSEIRRALVDFEAWTGGDEDVCVRSVDVVERADDDPEAGYWRPLTRRVGISGLDDPYQIALHELCHAWDHGKGWPSHDRGDLFPARSVRDHDGYPSVPERRAEAFADLCEHAWRDLRSARAWDARCEDGQLAAALDWIDARVLTHRPALPAAGAVPIGVETLRAGLLDPTATLVRAGAAGEHVLLFTTEGHDPRGGHRDFTLEALDGRSGAPGTSESFRAHDGVDLWFVPGTPAPALLRQWSGSLSWQKIDPSTGALQGERRTRVNLSAAPTWRAGNLVFSATAGEGGVRWHDLHRGGSRIQPIVGAAGDRLDARRLEVLDSTEARLLVWAAEHSGSAASLGLVDRETGAWTGIPIPQGVSAHHAHLWDEETVLVEMTTASGEAVPVLASPTSLALPDRCAAASGTVDGAVRSDAGRWWLTREGDGEHPVRALHRVTGPD